MPRRMNRGPHYPDQVGSAGPAVSWARQQAPDRPHAPHRPLWICRSCAHPWPCGEARVRLLREYAGARTALRIYLATRMHEAVQDLLALNRYEAPTAAEFFARFLAWVAPDSNR